MKGSKVSVVDAERIESAADFCYRSVVSTAKETGMTCNEEKETAFIMLYIAELAAKSEDADINIVIGAVGEALKTKLSIDKVAYQLLLKRKLLYDKVSRKEVMIKGIWWPGGIASFGPLTEAPLTAALLVFGDLLLSEAFQDDYENSPQPQFDFSYLLPFTAVMTRIIVKELLTFYATVVAAVGGPEVNDGKTDPSEKNNNTNNKQGNKQNKQVDRVSTTSKVKLWLERNVAASVIILLMAAGLTVLGVQYNNLVNEIKPLESQIEKQTETIKEKSASIDRLNSELTDKQNYEYVVKDFYLDHAVLIVNGDETYYHRYLCPSLPDGVSYHLFNTETAKGQGYFQCPICFGKDASTYCKEYIER